MSNRKPTLGQFLNDCAMPEERFYALYAALKLFYQVKAKQSEIIKELTGDEAAIFLTGAEAYCMIQELKQHFPIQSEEAEADYNQYFVASDAGDFDKCLRQMALLLTGNQKLAASSQTSNQ